MLLMTYATISRGPFLSAHPTHHEEVVCPAVLADRRAAAVAAARLLRRQPRREAGLSRRLGSGRAHAGGCRQGKDVHAVFASCTRTSHNRLGLVRLDSASAVRAHATAWYARSTHTPKAGRVLQRAFGHQPDDPCPLRPSANRCSRMPHPSHVQVLPLPCSPFSTAPVRPDPPRGDCVPLGESSAPGPARRPLPCRPPGCPAASERRTELDADSGAPSAADVVLLTRTRPKPLSSSSPMTCTTHGDEGVQQQRSSPTTC